MKKLKLLFAACALMLGVSTASAETDYTSLMSSEWTGSSGNFGGGKERYQGANYTEGQKVMYQSFTAPASGIYEIKFYAVTSSTSGRGFDNKWGPNIAQAYALVGESKATVAMEVINQTGCTLVADANIRTLSIEATEGQTIEYGLENIGLGGNWYTIKELSAKMKTVAEIFQAQYDEAYAIWEHSTENEVGAKATFKTYVDALNTAMSGSLAAAQTASDDLAAALVTYESKSYPVKGSGVKYDFTSKMNMAINAWTCKQGNGPAQYGFTGATETYGNTNAGDVMYQTISGLASGEYEIRFYAVANAANGGGVGGSKTIVYANNQENEIDVITQSSCTPSDYERTFTVMVKDGSITYGFKNTVAAGNWYICKNVALYMTGAPDLSDYYEAIAEKLITANGLKSSTMNSTVLSALQDAIDATDGYTDITVIGTLETMSENLTTAINNANTSISNYEDALSVLNAASTLDEAGQASYAADETVAAIQSAYDARTLENVSSEQKDVCASALRTAAKAQTTEGADMTLAIVNPSFETGNTTGWTYEVSVDHGAKPNSNGTYTMSNCDGDYLFNIWSSGNVISQEISGLPNGVYTVKAYIATDADHQVQINGNDQNIKINAVDKGTGVLGELEFTVFDNTAIIGAEGVDKYWYKVDDFHLTFVRAATVADYKSVLNDVISNASAISDAQLKHVGYGVFQINPVYDNDFYLARNAAKTVYDNASATIDEVEQAISDLNDAIDAFNNVVLNVPDPAKRYSVKLTNNGGWTYDDKAITYIANARADMGNYNVQYQAAPNANLAQAFTFTQVSGNTYKMSQTDAEGNTRYLCTGVPYSGGNTSQIRTTTEANDALVVEIRLAGAKNVVNIYNTEANNYIGSQDAGVFTVNSHINFTVAEASQATVDLNISSDVKYATRIFPFAPTKLPNGVVAYTCNGADENNNLTLDEADVVEANVPYILYAENGSTGSVSGWGVAAKTSYTAGWLTGVYSDTPSVAGNYVLQNQEGVVAFYQVTEEGDKPVIGANRCYLTVPAESEGRAAYFFGGVTGVENVEAASEATLKDGKYLVKGQIVIVKNGVKYNAAGAQVK